VHGGGAADESAGLSSASLTARSLPVAMSMFHVVVMALLPVCRLTRTGGSGEGAADVLGG